MRDKSQPPELELGVYEHFKGGRYEVEALAANEADGGGWIVFYHKLGETGLRLEPPLWRTYGSFIEPKLHEGQTIERYKKIDG